MAAPRISFSPSDILFGVLDRLFKDNATGKVLASRVAVVILLFMMAIVWYRGDSFFEYYKQSKYETYSEIIEKERNARFESVALEQLQIPQSPPCVEHQRRRAPAGRASPAAVPASRPV